MVLASAVCVVSWASLEAVADELVHAPTPNFRVSVPDDGVYRLAYDSLFAGRENGAVPSVGIGLRHRGEPQPIWVDDGGDGTFGTGDALIFVGERARHGEGDHPYARNNAYMLVLEDPAPARLRRLPPPEPGAASTGSRLRVEHRFERNADRAPFTAVELATEGDPWMWARLSQLRRQPFRIPLHLDHLAIDRSTPVSLRIRLFGWSTAGGPDSPDHAVEIAVGGTPVGEAVWDGRRAFELEIEDVRGALPPSAVADLTVAVRPRPGHGGPQVDVVYLDFVELDAGRQAHLGETPARLQVASASADGACELVAEMDRSLVAYGPGTRAEVTTIRVASSSNRRHLFTCQASPDPIWLVDEDSLPTPVEVEAVAPETLLERRAQVDYLIVAHPRLIEAIEPLAAHHRRGGLAVEVVDVTEIYAAFNHGLVHPRAIRDFFPHAIRHRRPPAARFALLVGDASWNGRLSDDGGRDLVPT
ncbi:MAG: C25 family cysteine peptidase, partial [Holophagales bacterium]|nr:C25 family cysteine peptidase [Holophagales bacterium]